MSLEQLKGKLSKKSAWIEKRYNYYEQKHLRPDPSPVITQRDTWVYNCKLGWCTKAVDSLANRLSFDGFRNDNFNLWEIFQMNNADVFFDTSVRSALISACSFVYISADEDGYPRLQVIDGKNATGNIDTRTNLLTEGYAILDTDEYGVPTLEAYFTPTETTYFSKGKPTEVFANPTGYVELVPVIYRPSDKRPFGHSRISKAAMDEMDQARFCLTRAAVTGEFGTIPQKYILGLDPSAEFDSIKQTYKSFMAIDKDSDGDKPVVGQFQQLSMTPHIESYNLHLKNFAGETGLSADDLGFMTANPSSAEAIRAGHSELELIARKAQDCFGSCFLNVGLVAASLRDEIHYNRRELYNTVPVWKPLFTLDNSAMGSFGDAVIKINQAIPDAIDKTVVKEMTGLPIEVEEE